MSTYAEVDVEGLISKYLRAVPAIVAATAGRVYTDLPNDRAYPLVLVQRSGGPPVSGFGLANAALTVTVYGIRHVDAQQLTASVLAALLDLPGAYDEGYVTNVVPNSTAYSPDSDSPDSAGHARPRYVSEITVTCHP
ncbi:hypothetical protein GCM10029976_090950 [Kribbella albertanoniae]|uniref:tail completion protein gp17 n=1 Tax=Kribbella albertanoniae TaxID=1266829 RepID=UPI001404D6AE|nr:DUF3168 domain-containing protein [Kribbella albertanoniae]